MFNNIKQFNTSGLCQHLGLFETVVDIFQTMNEIVLLYKIRPNGFKNFADRQQLL